MEQLVANLSSRAEQVIDARANERYQGKVRRAAGGPSFRAHPRQPEPALQQAVRCRDRHDEAAGDLRAAFSGAGVKLDAPIVTSCGSGVSAAVLTLALYRLGVENPALYDGSWTEWGAADGPPVATGPA